jgi:hypothetical protein
MKKSFERGKEVCNGSNILQVALCPVMLLSCLVFCVQCAHIQEQMKHKGIKADAAEKETFYEQREINANIEDVKREINELLLPFPNVTVNQTGTLITTDWRERREQNLLGKVDADGAFRNRIEKGRGEIGAVILQERFVIQLFEIDENTTSVTVRWTYFVMPESRVQFQTIEEKKMEGANFLNPLYNTHEEKKLLAKLEEELEDK